MICPKCKEEEKKSTVYQGISTSTLIGYTSYYDEDGIYHSHDPNSSTTNYSCSNGHCFSVSKKNNCPNCNYGKDYEKIHIQESSILNENIVFGNGTITFTHGSGMTFNTTTTSTFTTETNNDLNQSMKHFL